DVAGHLEFRNVSFSYPGADEPVLENISFTAAPGQTIGIIGSTGAGKTTLLNLIPRLIDTIADQVLIDDVPVTQYGRSALSKIVCMVPQKAYLFSGPMASNVRFGARNASNDYVWQALKTAQARDFVTAR